MSDGNWLPVVSPMSLQMVSDRGRIPMSDEIQNLKQEEYRSVLSKNKRPNDGKAIKERDTDERQKEN